MLLVVFSGILGAVLGSWLSPLCRSWMHCKVACVLTQSVSVSSAVMDLQDFPWLSSHFQDYIANGCCRDLEPW